MIISALPEPDLLPPNSQFDVATPASAVQPNLEAGSKPGNIELNLKAELWLLLQSTFSNQDVDFVVYYFLLLSPPTILSFLAPRFILYPQAPPGQVQREEGFYEIRY